MVKRHEMSVEGRNESSAQSSASANGSHLDLQMFQSGEIINAMQKFQNNMSSNASHLDIYNKFKKPNESYKGNYQGRMNTDLPFNYNMQPVPSSNLYPTPSNTTNADIKRERERERDRERERERERDREEHHFGTIDKQQEKSGVKAENV